MKLGGMVDLSTWHLNISLSYAIILASPFFTLVYENEGLGKELLNFLFIQHFEMPYSLIAIKDESTVKYPNL